MTTGKPNMGRETQGRGRQTVTLPPPPNRRVPRRITSKGEGGWALWRPQGTCSPGRWPPGQCPFREPWRVRGLGRPWRSGELEWPWWIRGLRRPWRSGELGWPWWIRGLRRPWRSGELGWPWWIRGLRRPWRSGELGWPWWIRGLRRPWRSGELGWPWWIGELGWPPWRVAPPPQSFLPVARSWTGPAGTTESWTGPAEKQEGAVWAGTGGRCLGAGTGGRCLGAGTGGHLRGVGIGAGLHLIPSYATNKPRGTWASVGGLAVLAGLRELRTVQGLRWSWMAADFLQTAGWTSRGRRRCSICAQEGKRQTKNFSKHRKTNEGGGAPLLLFSWSVLLSRCTWVSRNEEILLTL